MSIAALIRVGFRKAIIESRVSTSCSSQGSTGARESGSREAQDKTATFPRMELLIEASVSTPPRARLQARAARVS